MTTYILYTTQTPAERWATDLERQLAHEHIEIILLDADSPRGVQLAEHYDVTRRPAILVVRSDGSPVEVWQGMENIPLVNDIVYAAHS